MAADVNSIEIGRRIVDFVDGFPVQLLGVLSGIFRFPPLLHSKKYLWINELILRSALDSMMALCHFGGISGGIWKCKWGYFREHSLSIIRVMRQIVMLSAKQLIDAPIFAFNEAKRSNKLNFARSTSARHCLSVSIQRRVSHWPVATQQPEGCATLPGRRHRTVAVHSSDARAEPSRDAAAALLWQ